MRSPAKRLDWKHSDASRQQPCSWSRSFNQFRSDVAWVSSILDSDWYDRTQLRNGLRQSSAAEHYVMIGAHQGLDPHPLFSTNWYMLSNPDVVDAQCCPLAHFLEYGWRERRDPHPLFSTDYYSGRHRDVCDSNSNPFLHYLHHGASEGRSPHALFDAEWYLSLHPEGRPNPLIHFLSHTGRDAHPLFDDDFYVEQLGGDAPELDIPLLHYLRSGHRSADPNVLFDSVWYRARYATALDGEQNPLIHYAMAGADLGFRSHPLFDHEWYLASLSGTPSGRIGALGHYLHVGLHKSASPHVLFDFSAYLAACSETDQRPAQTLRRFLAASRPPGDCFHPLFDARHYLSANADVATAGINPLIHYLASGWSERRNPHPLFDTAHYLAENGDVAAANIEPLTHFLKDGALEERSPHPMFDTKWYLDQHETLRETGDNPLLHYLAKGHLEGRTPHPEFDGAWYLARYADVAASGVDPLIHYVLSGAAEGRAGHPPDYRSAVCDVLDIPYEIVKSPTDLVGRDACVFVTYASNGAIEDHAAHYLRALRQEGLTLVVVVVTDGLSRPLSDAIEADGILLRANHGWDFAAWAAAFAIFPDLWFARSLILTNDSLYGPIAEGGLHAIVDRVRSSRHDLVALTDSYQICRHFMSYFIGISQSGLASLPVRSFWNSLRSRKSKHDVIKHYELVPIAQWTAQGITCEIVFETDDDVDPPINPTLVQWRELVERGFPFLKVQMLRDRLEQVDSAGWEEVLEHNPQLTSIVTRQLDDSRRRDHGDSSAAQSAASSGAAPDATRRPIPAPKRRFHRNRQLTTFYGATQSMRPTEATDLALEVPFGHLDGDVGSPEPTIAVIAHIYYPELGPDLLAKIENIPRQADLFISTDSLEKCHAIEAMFGAYRNGRVTVSVFPNRGRDIGSLLVGYRDVFENYEYFLHIHSKRSPHQSSLSGWRDYLLENLLGSPEIVRSILMLLQHTDAGIVFPQHFRPVRKLLNWGYDYENARELLGKAGIAIRRDLALEFPSGSFFWGRSDALQPLLALDLDWHDFEEEKGQVDGTLAHAIERSLLYIAESTGASWAKVARTGTVPDETLVPVSGRVDLDRSLARTTRPLLANPLEPIHGERAIDEVIATATRKCAIDRPRLTLILPTLHPKHMFGGITTALRLFDELGASFDEPVDLRLLCTSVRLDVATMAAFPGYRLLTLGTPDDGLPRTIVDLTDQDAGELSIRRNDVFVATAWWTAHAGSTFQKAQQFYFKSEHPLIYLIQDYETEFYARSSRSALCEETYRPDRNQIVLINSEELAMFMKGKFTPKQLFCVPYRPNAQIVSALRPHPRERIVLVYGRASTPRNGFEAIRDALILWQQQNPIVAQDWRIIFVGETFDAVLAGPIQNMDIKGKLSLSEYAEILSRASVGMSLMLSPHPSYPPLEMAQAGLITIANTWTGKDLRLRCPNIVSPDSLNPQALTLTIEEAVSEAEQRIGWITPFSEIAPLACRLPMHDPAGLARRLATAWSSQSGIDYARTA